MVNKTIEESFGEFFRRLRKSKGFKWQKDLAESSGVSQTTISRIEDDTQNPQPDTLSLLSKTLDVSYTELMILAGHWKEDGLNEAEDNSADKKDSSSYENEKEFEDSLELSDEKLIEKFSPQLDGKTISEEEFRDMIAYIRVRRQMNS